MARALMAFLGIGGRALGPFHGADGNRAKFRPPGTTKVSEARGGAVNTFYLQPGRRGACPRA